MDNANRENLNKENLANELAEEFDLKKVKAREIVDSIFSKFEDALVKGEKVLVYGFGHFETKERKARQGYNPSTKEKMDIAATRTVSFKPAKGLKDAVKEKK